MYATLKTPYRGYRSIRLIEQVAGYRWEVEIVGSGQIIYVYEDEFTRE